MGLLVANVHAAFAGPFEVNDNSWEGCSSLLEVARAELGNERVIPLSDLDWSDLTPQDALLLLHPERTMSMDKLVAFLRAGGNVAVLDDFGAGNKILERFEIERVPGPSRPLSTLRKNPELAVAEPVRDPAGPATSVHSTVEDVDRLITNHPTGLRGTKAAPVLAIKTADGGDINIAMAEKFGNPARGKVFAMSDPSALINEMLRYPGNRAFALGLVRYLARDLHGEPRQGRIYILTNRFSESGSFPGTSGLPDGLQERIDSLNGDLKRLLGDGLSGVMGLMLAALVAFGIGVFTTSVASRVYRRRMPSFARQVPLLAQGGTAGRAAVLAAATTPAALSVLELKSMLEEAIAHELGLSERLGPHHLVSVLKEKRVLDGQAERALKDTLLEMAEVETLVAAGQSGRIKRGDVIRIAGVCFDILRRLGEARGARSAA